MKIRKSISVILALVLCLGIAPVATANAFAGDDVSERFTDISKDDWCLDAVRWAVDNDSQRSVPKTSANVRAGVLDVDQYKKAVKIVVNGKSDKDRIKELTDLGYTEEIAARFLSDQAAWLLRDEVSGPDNIDDGAKKAGHEVKSEYGYYGITAPWVIADLNLLGGGGQLATVFSWGTLCASDIISDIGTAEIH